MKKISKSLLVIFFGVLSLISFSQFAFADCDQADILRDISKTVDATAMHLRQSLEIYNRAAKNFETSCGEITEKYRKQKLSFDVRTLQQALAFDKAKYAYLTDMSQYENTDINWGSVPINTEQCEKLKIAAWEAQEHYTHYYTQAIVVFGIAGGANLPVSCVCPEGSNEQQCIAYTNAKIEEQQTADKCETFATYLSSLSSCPLCPLFQVVLNTDAKIADVAWRALSKALQSVVMMFFMVYLAFETLKIVSNIAGSSMGSYLKSILVLGAKVVFTYFLLDNSSYIYGYFVSPVIQAGLDMGTSLISVSSSQASICLTNNANVDFVATPGNVLDASLLDSIMRTVRCYGHTATIMPAIGKGLICHGWSGLLPDFSMWFSGVLFYVFGLMIWLVISFYLIDCTVQLGIVCALLPFLIACWPFRFTTRYSIKGVQLIMNMFFNYVMLGIVLLLGVEIVDFATGKRSGSLEGFIDAMNSNNLEKLSEIASLDGIEILVLIVCCIFAFKLIAMTNGLADKFSRGAGMDIASKMGGLAASVGVSALSGGAQAGGKILGAALEEAGIPQELSKAGESIKGATLDAASAFGRSIGLGKYQPGSQGQTSAPAKGFAPKTSAVDSSPKVTGKDASTVSGGKTTAVQGKAAETATEAPAVIADNQAKSSFQTSVTPEVTANNQTTMASQTAANETSINNVSMQQEQFGYLSHNRYRDKLGNYINIQKSEGGSISAIYATSASGETYNIGGYQKMHGPSGYSTNSNMEALKNIEKKLQQSPDNLNEIMKDVATEQQKYDAEREKLGISKESR